MDRGTDDKIREQLRRAGLTDHITDRIPPSKRDAKILPFRRVAKPIPASPVKQRIAGALYLMLLAAIMFVGLR